MRMKIQKIKIKVNKNTEIELSLEEAKELRKLLNDTFGDDQQKVKEIHHYPPRPYRYWTTFGDTGRVTFSLDSTAASATEILQRPDIKYINDQAQADGVKRYTADEFRKVMDEKYGES